jgi:hypothetical protein
MTKVTITFNVSDESYNDYESIIDGILNDLNEVGAEDIDVTEKETKE